ncbi:MAG: pyrimidine/purine nucleoside phosphorylase [Mariprofundaceae bacterium]|nr:pyrimidine/purine nucleoside phosphorylase [Mariprofundaceae bacterium]
MFQVNEYFDGKVKSLAFENEEGSATMGVMAEGEYVFNTSCLEVMQFISGSLRVQLPVSDVWQTFEAGESFEVSANKSFTVQVSEQTAYLCLYR